MSFYNKYILPYFLNMTMQSKDMENFRQEVAAEASGTVLEVGFGSGLNIPFYKNVSKLYALEPSNELWNLSQERVKSASFPIEFIQASAESIPLPDGSMDSVVSTWVMCSIPHPETALREVRRVLKTGGKFLFIEHGASPRSKVLKWQNCLTPVSKALAGGCHLNRNMESMLLEAGFKIDRLEKFEQPGKPLAYMYKGVVS